MGMDFIMYMPRPSLRPGKSAITREEWRRRTQSQHEVSALRERPHQVETLGGKSVVAEEQRRSTCRGGRTRGPEGHRPQGPSLGCTRQRRRRETVQLRHDTAKGLRQTSPRGFARTTALEGVPCAGAGSTQTSGSRSAARAGRARRRARRETVGAARPGNRRAHKAKAIGEPGGEGRESWSDAGGRGTGEGVLRKRVGYE